MNAEITNSVFIDTLFGKLPEESCVPVASINDTSVPGWPAKSFENGQDFTVRHGWNGYYCLGIHRKSNPQPRRKDSCLGLCMVMLDDVGTKADRDKIKLTPTYAIETSPGNYQLGYRLTVRITDMGLVDRLGKAIIREGLSDPGAGGLGTRYARLPQCWNTKYNPPFQCRLTEWNPEIAYSPQELVDGLGLELDPPKPERKSADPIKRQCLSEVSPYVRKALEDELQELASMPPDSGRNVKLNRVAFIHGQFVAGDEIREEDARLALQQAAAACGLDEVEADKTIRSGLAAGMAEPRQAPGASDWNPDGGQRAGKDSAKQARAQECKDGIFNGADLLEMDLPEIVFAVVGLLPMGLAILAGGPKLGKSWLIYCICAALGAGRRVLGHFRATQAKSLYLALEDSKRRLQDRLKALCNTDPAIKAGLANVDFQISWPRFDDEGGLEKLEEYVKENVPHGLKLVVVDTLAKVMPKSKSKGLNAYEADSIIMSRIKSIADKYGVCILIVTHLSKLRTSKDPFDSITGSMGQFGTADTAMLLTRKRGAPTAILQTTGRDIEGNSYDLSWSNPGWSCQGIANEEELELSPERLAILRVFKDDGGALSPNMVAQATGKTPSNTGKLIKKLVEEGFLLSVGYGMYSLVPSGPSGRSVPSSPSVPSGVGGLGQVGILGMDSLGDNYPDEVTI